MEWTSCAVVYTASYGLTRSLTVLYGLALSHAVSHGFVRSLIRLYTDMAPVSVFESFKNHTRLSRIHSNGPSVTRMRPRLVRLYVRFTRMANRISRRFCVRQALPWVKGTVLSFTDQRLLCIGLDNEFDGGGGR